MLRRLPFIIQSAYPTGRQRDSAGCAQSQPRLIGRSCRSANCRQLAILTRAPMSPDKPDELRVLVVDDDIDAANSLSYLLQISGHPTAVAYGGSMGLRIAQLFKRS